MLIARCVLIIDGTLLHTHQCTHSSVLFCPLIDESWYALKQSEKYYNFAIKASARFGLGLLPIFGFSSVRPPLLVHNTRLIFSQRFLVQDPRVQTLMKRHECLYAKLDEVPIPTARVFFFADSFHHQVKESDIDNIGSHVQRHVTKYAQVMKEKVCTTQLDHSVTVTHRLPFRCHVFLQQSLQQLPRLLQHLPQTRAHTTALPVPMQR